MNVDVKASPAGGMLLAEPPEIARVGVIGAGQMGNGIAHVCALAGLPVTMLDVKAEPLKRAVGTIARNMERQVNRSLISTSFITGTGFMKCMPMNFSGRSVAAPSRVIEIDDVFEASRQDGCRCGVSARKIACLTSSFSVAASMTMSQSANSE